MPIALLKFPTDLLREVFKVCEPFDLYKLSKCSKKCSRKLITLGGTKKWDVSFDGRKDTIIRIDSFNYYFNRTDDPEDYFKINLGRYGNYMYIEFPNGGAVELFFHLLDTFGIRIVKSLKITFLNVVNALKVAKVLVDRNMEIEQVVIGHFEEKQDVVNFMPMLNKMNVSQEFRCLLRFPPDFHFDFVNYPKKIHLTDSCIWFNINQLLHCTCAHISLMDSMLSNQDLDVFMKEWKNADTFPNLRVLKIESMRIDNQSPILDMIPPITISNHPKIKVSIRHILDGEVIDAVRVIKDDGTVGWLKVELGDWPKFKFLIADQFDTVVEEIPNNEDDD
ncbi:unnamed protein product [Caenorhabditis nigoni]